jgi:hypothetical protein
MRRLEVSLLQFKILVKSIDGLPDGIKDAFLEAFEKDLLKKELSEKIFTIRSAYNIFNLIGAIGSENLFLNGRTIFTGDMGKIFFFLAEEFSSKIYLSLFPGCEISRDFSSSYINLCLNLFNYENKDFTLADSSKPLETLTINTKYSNKLISQLKEILI